MNLQSVIGDTTLFVCLFDDVKHHFQQYCSYMVVVSFTGGGNWRKPPTCRKSLTNFYHKMLMERRYISLSGNIAHHSKQSVEKHLLVL
jgi:hypothetical protein